MPYKIIPAVQNPYPGIHWVHPLKQKAIEELIAHVEKNFLDVEAIVVFGSTVNGNCNTFSDIDIMIVGDADRKYYSPDNDVYDVHHADSIHRDSALWKAIEEEGLVVYAKSTSTENKSRPA